MPAALEAPVNYLGHQRCCGHRADASQLDQNTGFLPLRESRGLFAESSLSVRVESSHGLQDEMKSFELAGDLGTQLPSKLSPIARSELRQSPAPVAAPQPFDLSDAMKG